MHMALWQSPSLEQDHGTVPEEGMLKIPGEPCGMAAEEPSMNPDINLT